MSRQKGNKDYSQREKQMMVSLINDYSLFGASDNEMIQMISKKIGKENNEKISETLFYRLKKEAIKKRGDSGEWLDYYSRFHFVEYYRKRMEELELVQKKILKTFIDETDKQEEKQNKPLINQLAKTISDNSKVLAEFGMAPPIISKIKSMIPLDVSAIDNNNKKELISGVKDESTESNLYARFNLEYPQSAIFPPIDSMDLDNKEENSTDDYDPNRVF